MELYYARETRITAEYFYSMISILFSSWFKNIWIARVKKVIENVTIMNKF